MKSKRHPSFFSIIVFLMILYSLPLIATPKDSIHHPINIKPDFSVFIGMLPTEHKNNVSHYTFGLAVDVSVNEQLKVLIDLRLISMDRGEGPILSVSSKYYFDENQNIDLYIQGGFGNAILTPIMCFSLCAGINLYTSSPFGITANLNFYLFFEQNKTSQIVPLNINIGICF
jgi:hypothetical protein